MGQQPSYEEPECWAEEKALSEEERKERYHCKPAEVVKLDDIPHWDTVAEETLEKGTICSFERLWRTIINYCCNSID